MALTPCANAAAVTAIRDIGGVLGRGVVSLRGVAAGDVVYTDAPLVAVQVWLRSF